MTSSEGWELDAARFERKTLVVMLKDFWKRAVSTYAWLPLKRIEFTER